MKLIDFYLLEYLKYCLNLHYSTHEVSADISFRLLGSDKNNEE